MEQIGELSKPYENMGTFLAFIGKFLSSFGVSIEEEETREALKDGSQNISDDLISSHKSYAFLSEVDTDLSILEVNSEESLSACSQNSSIESPSGVNYNSDNPSKVKLNYSQKTSAEPDSNPAKGKKKAVQLVSLDNQNEQLVVEPSTSSHPYPRSSNYVTPISSNATAVSASSGQLLGSHENGRIPSEPDSSHKLPGSQKTQQAPQKINYDEGDDALSKGKLTSTRNTITESDTRPLENKKKAARCQRKALKISLLNIRNKQLTGESSTSFHSDPLRSKSIGNVGDSANGVSKPSSQGTSEYGQILAKTDYLHCLLGSQKTQLVSHKISCDNDDHSSKAKLVCQQNTISETDSKPLESKKKVSRSRKRKAKKPSLLNITNAQLIGESSTTSRSDPLRSKSIGQVCGSANEVSVPSSRGTCGNGHLLVKTESKALKSKKKAPRSQKRKAKKLSLLNITNAQLIGESSTTSHSDPLRSKSIGQVCGSANEVSVPCSRGTCGNGHFLVKTESKALKSKKKVPRSQKRKAKIGESSTTSHSDPLRSKSIEQGCGSSNKISVPSSQGTCGNGQLLAETDSSKKILTCLQNMNSESDCGPLKNKKRASKQERKAINIKPKNFMTWVAKKKPSSTSHLISIQQLPDLLYSSKKSYLVNGSTNASLDKVNVSGYLHSVEQESHCNQNPFEEYNGSHDSLGSDSFIHDDVADYPMGKLTSLQNTITEPDSTPVKSKKKASKHKARKISSLNIESEQLIVDDPPSSNSVGHISNRVMTAINVPCNQLLDSGENGHKVAEPDSLPNVCGSQKSSLPVPQKVTSDTDAKKKEVKLRVMEDESSSKTSCLVNGSAKAALKKTTLPESNGSHPHDKASKSYRNAGKVVEKKIHGYCSSQKILLVGDGNFSFSACLARVFNSAANMVATSLNSEDYLIRYYKDAMDNISELQKRGCRVMHEVDATTIANHSDLEGQFFDRIIYNFPHCGDFSPTKSALRKNRRLVRLFMENSSKMIKEDGEIHIRHKLSTFFSQWNVIELASEVGLVLIEEAPFNIHNFKGYNAKYGFEGGKFGSDDNFNCYPSCTYKFALPRHQKKLGRQTAS